VASAPASAGDGRFQVQLASFATQAEASAEYQRLAAKHGAIITRYAPIIEPAQVAGTTRYKLNLGPMATNDVAQNVCSTLIAAGERDCLVHQ
jgi:cell division septation protein DedD